MFVGRAKRLSNLFHLALQRALVLHFPPHSFKQLKPEVSCRLSSEQDLQVPSPGSVPLDPLKAAAWMRWTQRGGSGQRCDERLAAATVLATREAVSAQTTISASMILPTASAPSTAQLPLIRLVNLVILQISKRRGVGSWTWLSRTREV